MKMKEGPEKVKEEYETWLYSADLLRCSNNSTNNRIKRRRIGKNYLFSILEIIKRIKILDARWSVTFQFIL